MPYKRSIHRVEFDERLDFLLKKSRRAQRLRASDSDIRDLVFQCAIFQTSAALETYLRLLLESWVQKLKTLDKGASTPQSSRAYLTAKRLDNAFASYRYTSDERALVSAIANETALWPLMQGADKLPAFFTGKEFHTGSSYPSYRNIRRLFNRVGVDDMMGKLNSKLSRDTEILIEGFQSLRTALAHSLPPTITISDVEARLKDAKDLVGAIDRIFFGHVIGHGGIDCW